MSQFSIRHLLAITLVSGLAFATARWIGLDATLRLAVLAIVATPTLAFVVGCLPAKLSLRRRIQINVAIALAVFSVLFLAAALVAGAEGVVALIFSVGIFWGGQWLFWAVIYSAWKSGIESAKIAEESLHSPSDVAK